jgi:hypothetical protein
MTNNLEQMQQTQQTLLLQLLHLLFAQSEAATRHAIGQPAKAHNAPQLDVFNSAAGIRDVPQATVLSQTALALVKLKYAIL